MKTGNQLAMSIRSHQKQNHKGLFIFPTSHGMWKFIYKLNNFSKNFSRFWWKSCWNFLPNKENLHHLSHCPICHKEPETSEHLLFRCGCVCSSGLVWFGSHLNYKVDPKAISYVMMKRTMYIV